MSACIKTHLPCPSCKHGLNKENTTRGTVWIWCGNIFCASPVCDNGQEGPTEYEAFTILCVEYCQEKPRPEPEPEMSVEDERELKETRLGEWKLETQRGEP